MSIITTDNKHYTDIAAAIRGKNGTETQYKPNEMAAAISAIETGGGAVEEYFKTPEEIYEQYRPADWPVLPDPTQNNEYWILYSRISSQSTYGLIAPSTGTKWKHEWGYIDEDTGEFVIEYSTNNVEYTSWSKMGGAHADDGRLYKVLHLTCSNNNNLCEQNTSSSQQTSSLGPFVLEIKARPGTGASGFLASYKANDYSATTTNLRFVKFYGATYPGLKLSYMFKSCNKLKCILFDSEENNFLTNGLNNSTTTAYMFSQCYQLEYAYSTNLPSVTTWNYMYDACRTLPYIKLKMSGTPSITNMFSNCFTLREIEIDASEVTGALNNLISTTCYGLRKVKSLSTPLARDVGINIYSAMTEALNVKLGTYSNYSIGKSVGLKRLVLSSDSDFPTSFDLTSYVMEKEGIQEFLESIPAGASSVLRCQYSVAMVLELNPELIALATEKGCSVAFS